MRNARPPSASVPSSVRPSRRCFPLCGGSDDRDRDFGPDTFRGEKKRREGIRGREREGGTHNAEAFFVGCKQLWSGLDSGAKQGVKRSSIRGGAEGRRSQRKSEPTNAVCLRSPLALTCLSQSWPVGRSFWRSWFVRLDQKMRSNRRRAERERERESARQFPSSSLGGHGRRRARVRSRARPPRKFEITSTAAATAADRELCQREGEGGSEGAGEGE